MALSIDVGDTGNPYEGSLSIDTGNYIPPLVPEVAQNRAFKAWYGLPELGKPVEDYIKSLSENQEPQLRIEAATAVDRNKAVQTNQLITEMAKRKGSPLSLEEAKSIKDMAQSTDTTDPETVFEVAYAKEYLNYLNKAFPEQKTDWSVAQQEAPEDVKEYLRTGGSLLAKTEFLRTFSENAESEARQQSWGGWFVDQAKQLIPFYYEGKMRNNVPGSGTLSGLGVGSAQAQQGKELFRLPLPQFKQTVKDIYEGLAKDNPSLAAQFIQSLKGMSTDEQVLNDMFTAMELPIIGTVAKGVVKGGMSLSRRLALRSDMQRIVKEAIKNSADAPTPAKIADAVGDQVEAGTQKVLKDTIDEVKGNPKPLVEQAKEDLPNMFRHDAEEIGLTPGASGRELATRIKGQVLTFAQKLDELLSTRANVERVPVIQGLDRAVRSMVDRAQELFPGLENTIMNLDKVVYENKTNTYWADLVLGKRGTEYFARREEATQFARANKLKDFTVQPKGMGYYVSVRRPLDETSDVIRDLLVSTKETKDSTSWLSSWLGWIRTSDEVLSYEQRLNRKVAAYGASNFLKLAKEEAKYIGDLTRGVAKYDPVTGKPVENMTWGIKTRFKDWERIVKFGRTAPDPGTGEPGYFFKNVAELEDAYQRFIKRLPDEVEIQAYFAYKNIVEADAVLREMSIYRNKVRLGVLSHSFTIDGLETGSRVKSPSIDGKIVPNFPGSEATIAVVGKKLGQEKLYDSKHVPPTILKKLRKDIEDGRKVVLEIYNPEERPLQGFGSIRSERVRYVIADAYESENISRNQLPRRGGGHWEYDHDFYIKAPIIRPEKLGAAFRRWYEGDATIMGVSNRAEGEKWAKLANEARIYLKDNNVRAARDIVENKLNMQWKEFNSWFHDSKDLNGKTIGARLSKDEEIRVVESNKMIGDLDNRLRDKYPDTFKDGTKEGSMARQHQVQFTGQRDSFEIFSLQDKGSRHNPLFSYEPGRMVDPMPTMARALAKISNSLFMDDYKIFSIEHWLQQAKPYLKAEPSEIKAAPFYHFHNPEFKSGVDLQVKSQLMGARWHALQFLGQKDMVSSFLDNVTNKLMDATYKYLGPTAAQYTPLQLLPKITDGARYMRNVAFDLKLGMFAIPQILVQNATWGVIYAISPRQAMAASASTLMHQWARISAHPNIIAKMDETLSKLRIPGMTSWRPGEFKEAYELLKRTGFSNVMGEYALLDSAMYPKLTQGTLGTILEAGRFFFTEAERNVRIGAWYTAYKEFREINPTGRVTERDLRKILDRADLMTVNMSRASNSALHTGLASMTAQFLTYQLRLAELTFGKRLTTAERMRLFGVQAALYGIPVATGVTGIPFSDSMRQYALSNGYVVGNNAFDYMATEGIPAYMMYMATGNKYNIGERYGSQGFEALREFWRGDKEFTEVLLGASGTIFKKAFESLGGLQQSLMSLYNDGGTSHPLKADDFIEPARQITSVNAAYRSIMAAKTQRWMSQNNTYLTDASTWNSVFMGITGLQPQDVNDAQLLAADTKDMIEFEKDAGKMFQSEYRKFLLAVRDENEGQAEEYFKRSKVFLNWIREDRRATFLNRAAQDNESLVKQLDRQFYLKDAPDDKRQLRLKAFRDKKLLEEQGK